MLAKTTVFIRLFVNRRIIDTQFTTKQYMEPASGLRIKFRDINFAASRIRGGKFAMCARGGDTQPDGS